MPVDWCSRGFVLRFTYSSTATCNSKSNFSWSKKQTAWTCLRQLFVSSAVSQMFLYTVSSMRLTKETTTRLFDTATIENVLLLVSHLSKLNRCFIGGLCTCEDVDHSTWTATVVWTWWRWSSSSESLVMADKARAALTRRIALWWDYNLWRMELLSQVVC